MLSPQDSHVKSPTFYAFTGSGALTSHLLFFLIDAVHHAVLFEFTPLFSLLPELCCELLTSLVALLFLLLLLVSLLLFFHLCLGTFATLLLDLCTASELVPHFSSTFHEILIFHLL